MRLGILDFEDNQDEWAERLHRVGVPPGSVPYLAPHKPLTAPATIRDVRAWLDGEGVDVPIIDSVIHAAGGADAMKPEAPVAYYGALRECDCQGSLTLAHVPKDKATADQPMGSTYWSAPQRLVYRVERLSEEPHVIQLTNTKHSRWPYAPTIILEVDWSDRRLRAKPTINLTADGPPRTQLDQVVLAIATAGRLLTVREIAERTQTPVDGIKKVINRHPGRFTRTAADPTMYGLAGA